MCDEEEVVKEEKAPFIVTRRGDVWVRLEKDTNIILCILGVIYD